MANFNFNQVEFMQRVKEMRATWETLKRQAAKRCVEAKYDPKMNEEDRLEIEQEFKNGAPSIENFMKGMERGYIPRGST